MHYFGLDCGMLEFLQIFFSEAVIQRPLDFPEFLEQGLAEKIALCVNTTRVPNKKFFCMKRLNILVFSNIQNQNNNCSLEYEDTKQSED